MSDQTPETRIYKIDEDERLVFGWASVVTKADGSLVVDSDDEAIEPDELEAAVYDYVLTAKGAAGELHKGEPIGRMVESFVLTPEKAEVFGKALGVELPEITGWWFGAKVDDPDVFAKVKSGEYRMFSIQGTGEKAEAPVTS